MCVDPVTLSIGATVLGAGLGIMDQSSKAGAASSNRAAAMDTALHETIPSINQSLAQVYNANQGRAIQESDKAATEAFDVTRQMAEAKGAAVAAAGTAGVTGNSFATILGDFEMREGMAAGTRDYNYKVKAQQTADDNNAAKGKAQAQINTVLNNAVASTPVPSPLSTLAGMAGTAAGAGLKIGDKYGLFDAKTKIDPTTGITMVRK